MQVAIRADHAPTLIARLSDISGVSVTSPEQP
jgi:hypothetical protein